MVPGHPWALAQMATPRRYMDPAHIEDNAAALYGAKYAPIPSSRWSLRGFSRLFRNGRCMIKTRGQECKLSWPRAKGGLNSIVEQRG
jgi:hypothetical protein